MKNSIKILFLFSCVLILSACTNPFAKTEMAQVQEGETQKIYSCNDLKSKTARENCINEASWMALDALNSEIIRTFDIKRCSELPGEMADSCVSRIQESGVRGPVSEAEITALSEAMRFSYRNIEGEDGEMIDEASGYYDISKCSALTASGLKEYCEKQLNRRIEDNKLWEIIESGNANKCDELTDESFVRMCKIELGIYVEEIEVFEEMTEPEIAEDVIEEIVEPEIIEEMTE